MKQGLIESLQPGAPQPDIMKASSDQQRYKDHAPQGPPSCSLSTAIHWRRLDPSETIVLNQSTLLRVNDLLQSEIQKRQNIKTVGAAQIAQGDDSTTQSQGSQKQNEKEAVSEIKSSDIIRQCHKGIASLKQRKQLLKKRKYEEFVKFAQDHAA